MMKATTMEATYSMRSWPKGCSSSAGLLESLKLRMVITEEPASDRLLNASAVMAMEPLKTPARYFPANSSTLRRIPTMLHSIP